MKVGGAYFTGAHFCLCARAVTQPGINFLHQRLPIEQNMMHELYHTTSAI